MGDDKDRPADPAAPEEALSTDPATLAPTLLSEGREPAPRAMPETQPLHPPAPARPAPGHIPEPPEKRWDAEHPDPFDGVDRASPFEGRPRSAVPGGEEAPLDRGEAPGPGQPLRRGGSDGEQG